ncbi:hypothetical protein RvY_18340 [Ramazzottius varieornatus]|uniref:Uncharacterized protein n=1 Tax=Ramazzottius varieornatus TaxID=947166 RepID=A0A1D1W5G5_RAMVA|nr:hypothetical protein RvY_18340 [Ramazzottius varieornatus]
MGKLSQWLDEREPVVPALEVVGAQIASATALLHPTNLLLDEVYIDIVSAHIKRKEHRAALLGGVDESYKAISPEDRMDVNCALESGRLLCVELEKPKPNEAKVNGFFRNLADYFLEDGIETYF